MPVNERNRPVNMSGLPSTENSVLAHRLRPPPQKRRLTLTQVLPLVIVGVVGALVVKRLLGAGNESRDGVEIVVGIVVVSAIQSAAHFVSELMRPHSESRRNLQKFCFWIQWAVSPFALAIVAFSGGVNATSTICVAAIALGIAAMFAILTFKPGKIGARS